MSELDAEWQRVLAEVERRAHAKGRGDVADYVRLRATNDAARNTGIKWLLGTFTQLAGEANRRGANINIESSSGEIHRFSDAAATMVGVQSVLRFGVRTLTIEAGYPRQPADGFVRGGGLARANLKHFGDVRAGRGLLLVRDEKGVPRWFTIEDETNKLSVSPFVEADAAHHILRFAAVR